MPRIFKTCTGSCELIEAVAGKKIVLTHVWIKLENGWTAGDLFALQFDNSTNLMYPRDNKGVEHCDNEHLHGRTGESLRAYYQTANGKIVYLDLGYKLTV